MTCDTRSQGCDPDPTLLFHNLRLLWPWVLSVLPVTMISLFWIDTHHKLFSEWLVGICVINFTVFAKLLYWDWFNRHKLSWTHNIYEGNRDHFSDCVCTSILKPFSHNINIGILFTAVQMFLIILVGRSCFNMKRVYLRWSFLKFSWTVCLDMHVLKDGHIQKLDADHYWPWGFQFCVILLSLDKFSNSVRQRC